MRKIYLVLLILFLFPPTKLIAATPSEAYNAVAKARACYRSLPSHYQKGSTLDSLYKATKYYKDAAKFQNMGRSDIARAYFNNAKSYADIVVRIGRTVGSRSC